MGFDANILRAMLRIARRREASDVDAVILRVGATEGDVRRAFRRLQTAGLIEIRLGRAPRLTMTGLAVAVALLPRRTGRSAPGRASRAA